MSPIWCLNSFLLAAKKFHHGEALQMSFQIQFTEVFHTLTGIVNTIIYPMRKKEVFQIKSSYVASCFL